MPFFTLAKQAIQEERLKNFTKAYNLFKNTEKYTSSSLVKIKIISRRAWCLEQVGNHSSAEELIKKIIILFHDYPEAYLQKALYYIKIKKFKSSKSVLRAGIKLYPDCADLYLTLAFILKETERWNESIDVLKKALLRENLSKAKHGIGKQDIWNELGHLYYERGNYNSSVACLKKAISINGNLMICYSTLSKAYLQLDDPLSTLKYINQLLLKFDVLDTDDYIVKARAHTRLKEYELALECLQIAYEENEALYLKTEDMIDFSNLIKNGLFDNFQNIEID